MPYPKHRFNKYTGMHRGADGVLRQAAVHSYKAANAEYEVAVIDGLRLVRVNDGPLSNFISDWQPAHYAIETHFGL